MLAFLDYDKSIPQLAGKVNCGVLSFSSINKIGAEKLIPAPAAVNDEGK
jgi:hypothetical protein